MLRLLSTFLRRVGVTRSGNWWCHPIFLPKTDDLFQSPPLESDDLSYPSSPCHPGWHPPGGDTRLKLFFFVAEFRKKTTFSHKEYKLGVTRGAPPPSLRPPSNATDVHHGADIISPLTTGGERLMFSGRPVGRPSVNISSAWHDDVTIYMYLAEWFQWNLPQVIAENVLKARSRSTNLHWRRHTLWRCRVEAHLFIGVARIFSGGALFPQKCWLPFFSRHPSKHRLKLLT